MKRFKCLEIEIEGGDDALSGSGYSGELAAILRRVADELSQGDDYQDVGHGLHDTNGNRVGSLVVEFKEVEPDGWLCDDCVSYLVNGDLTGVDYYLEGDEAAARCREIESGARRLGYVSVDSEVTDEFSREECDCCGTGLAGGRTGYYQPEG